MLEGISKRGWDLKKLKCHFDDSTSNWLIQIDLRHFGFPLLNLSLEILEIAMIIKLQKLVKLSNHG